MYAEKTILISLPEKGPLEIVIEGTAPEGIPLARRTFKRAERRARVYRAACGTRVSCRRCIPHARGRAIKRMQIKTFYLNDNITLVDASALA